MSGSSPRRVAIVLHARARVAADFAQAAVRFDAARGRALLTTGRTPREPAWLKALAPLLWPFGLHSVFAAEKPAAPAGGAR